MRKPRGVLSRDVGVWATGVPGRDDSAEAVGLGLVRIRTQLASQSSAGLDARAPDPGAKAEGECWTRDARQGFSHVTSGAVLA